MYFLNFIFACPLHQINHYLLIHFLHADQLNIIYYFFRHFIDSWLPLLRFHLIMNLFVPFRFLQIWLMKAKFFKLEHYS